MPKPVRVFFLALVLASVPWIASAQNAIEAVLSAPDTSSYPVITTSLRIRDGEGRFVSGLTTSDVVMLENGAEVPVETLEEQFPGAQIVVAINPSPGFAVRDSNGASRYDYVVQALNSWAESRGNASGDVLSFVMTNSENTTGVGYPGFLSALEAAPTDHRNAVENVGSLNNALEIVNFPLEGPPKGRAILFITSQASVEEVSLLETLASQAKEANTRIFVWLVTSEAFFETRGALSLQLLADETGGQMFSFSGTETLPDPEIYFDALRRQYAVSYSSQITTSGEFELAARIESPGVETVTAPRAFNLTVLPPNPIFVSPPSEIYRALVPDTDGNLSAEQRTPEEQTIEILIEFPDGYQRELVRTTLYVDGKIAAENTAPPFDRFTWPLTGIDESGRRVLQVEALDTFGLSSISLQTPVDITVQRIPDGFVPSISRNSPLVVTIVVLLVGGVLIAVLLRFRKLRPETQPGNGRRKKQDDGDPVYQPVEVEARQGPARLSRWTNRLQWPQRSTPRGEPIAFLERLYDANSLEALTPSPPLPLHNREVTLGNDPSQATFVLEDPSVAGLHARLHQNAEEEFFISDYDTIAGTYINYRPTNGSPTRIEHGDQIHFGKVGFRFRVHPAPQTTPPSIEPEEKAP